MSLLIPFALDALIFVLAPWALWRLLGRTMPFAVLPIVIGLALAASGWSSEAVAVPSMLGNQVGWVGVLVLAFTAGLEMRHGPDENAAPDASARITLAPSRVAGSAAAALLVPFAVGAVAAHLYFLALPGWGAERGMGGLGALAIGLCLAVSALPVLIGIVRELPAAHRPLGQLSLNVAVIDDAVLWIGLALLLVAANGPSALSGWSGVELLAVGALAALVWLGHMAAQRLAAPPAWMLWLIALLYLAVGAWASWELGLHALLGAYFGGAVMPPAWVRRLPVERLGTVALFVLAPLFFGHGGLRIDGAALTWQSMLASFGLLVISVVTKVGVVLAYPPSAALSRREAMGVGALLQCKGLMEIVAATILRDEGLLSEFAYAALVALAVLSTALTGPMFRLFVRHRTPATAPPSGTGPVCPPP
jgi:Kef-type K+ transport system membrane component KefB